MAENQSFEYGRDVRCLVDADELWSELEGLDVVKQDAMHRMTTVSVLGPSETEEEVNAANDWGVDCTELLGMTDSELMAAQPRYAIVLQKDPRISESDVVFTKTKTNGLDDVSIAAHCVTAKGPFDIITSVLELTASYAKGQA